MQGNAGLSAVVRLRVPSGLLRLRACVLCDQWVCLQVAADGVGASLREAFCLWPSPVTVQHTLSVSRVVPPQPTTLLNGDCPATGDTVTNNSPAPFLYTSPLINRLPWTAAAALPLQSPKSLHSEPPLSTCKCRPPPPCESSSSSPLSKENSVRPVCITCAQQRQCLELSFVWPTSALPASTRVAPDRVRCWQLAVMAVCSGSASF
jgi:hypothetical protein